MSVHPSADLTPIVSPDSVRLRIQAVLRAAQTKFTDAELEQLTGVSARCIKSYRVEGREPSLSNALSILHALGQLNAVLSLVGCAASALEDANALQVNALVAEGLRHWTTIAECAADGRIDHTEEPRCRAAADGIIATVLPLASAGGAQ